MNELTNSEEVYTLTSEYRLISNDRVSVVLREQCLWTPLLENSQPVGIAFMGPSIFAVDAITETRIGAVGRSITGAFNGIQLYFGDASTIRSVSRPANDSDVVALGLTDLMRFRTQVRDTVYEYQQKTDKTSNHVHKERQVLVGKDEHSVDVLLVVSRHGLVIRHGERTIIMKDDGLVSVEKGCVTLGKSHGSALVIDQHFCCSRHGHTHGLREHGRGHHKMIHHCDDFSWIPFEFRCWHDWR